MHESGCKIMKSKITSFIMTIITILAIGILIFLGIIIYNKIGKTNVSDEVQEFVSNITISSVNKNEDIKNPEVIENLSSSLESIDEIENNGNTQIDKYFYNQLDEYSKIIYNEMEQNKENMKTGTYEIDLGTKLSPLLSKSNGEELLGSCYQSAIESYTYDNPDVFYIDFSKLYLNIETTTKGNNTTYKVLINSGNDDNYLTDEFSSKERIDAALNEIEKIKTYFIQNKKSNTYENIKLIHDYVVESIEYEQTTSQSNIYDLYGALVNKKSVCEGYAKAFKYLMDNLGIPCTIVIGKATNSEENTENHAWNYVQIDGSWYAVDCTWDDPIIVGSGNISDSSKYRYFLKGENEISQTHMPNGQFTENGKVFTFPTLSTKNY